MADLKVPSTIEATARKEAPNKVNQDTNVQTSIWIEAGVHADWRGAKELYIVRPNAADMQMGSLIRS